MSERDENNRYYQNRRPRSVEASIAVLTEQVEQMRSDMTELKDSVKNLESLTGKWKGGFFVLIILGGVASWLTTFLYNIFKVFHG